MSYIFGIMLAVFIGAILCLQPIFSSNMGKYTGIVEAAFISITITFALILMIFLIFGKGDISRVSEAPKYYLFAGVFGTIIVTGSIFIVQILGPAVALSVSVAAQIILSVLLEHFGVFGVEKIPISTTRVLGILLMIAGVIFIKGLSK